VLSGASVLRRLLLLVLSADLSSSGSAMCSSVREIRECVMMKSALRRSSPLAWNGLLASAGRASSTGSLTHTNHTHTQCIYSIDDVYSCNWEGCGTYAGERTRLLYEKQISLMFVLYENETN